MTNEQMLRYALERIATVDHGGGFLGAQACREIARQALAATRNRTHGFSETVDRQRAAYNTFVRDNSTRDYTATPTESPKLTIISSGTTDVKWPWS